MSKKTKTIVMLIIISLGAGVMYQVPYLKQVFYDPLREALGVTHTELGTLSGIYGTVAMLGYLPGGILADKFRAKYLFSGSMIICGILIFWYATIPSFRILQIIHFLLGIFTSITFWSARIKIVRFISSDDNYATNQGISTGLYGFAGMVSSFVALYFIENMLDGLRGLQLALIYYAVIHIVLGILSFISIPKFENELDPNSRLNLKEFVSAVKTPAVWMVSISSFMIWMIYICLQYTTPYLTNIYVAPVALITAISIIRSYGINIISSPLSGIWASRVKSVSKLLRLFSILTAALLPIMFILPISNTFVLPVVIISLVLAFFATGMNALMFTQLGEVGTPINIYGAASGIASMFCYMPDIFAYTLIGGWLDHCEGATGYYRIFLMAIAAAVVNVLACTAINREGKKYTLSKENLKGSSGSNAQISQQGGVKC